MLKPILLSTLLATPWTQAAFAAPPENPRPPVQAPAAKTHDGKIVSIAEGKLVMTDNDGKNQQTHAITPTAKITLGGKSARLNELMTGDRVKVTISAEGVVTMVEATRPAPTL